jgi:hypothetical protein
MQDYLGHRDPKHTAITPELPDIASKGCGNSPKPGELDPKPDP